MAQTCLPGIIREGLKKFNFAHLGPNPPFPPLEWTNATCSLPRFLDFVPDSTFQIQIRYGYMDMVELNQSWHCELWKGGYTYIPLHQEAILVELVHFDLKPTLPPRVDQCFYSFQFFPNFSYGLKNVACGFFATPQVDSVHQNVFKLFP